MTEDRPTSVNTGVTTMYHIEVLGDDHQWYPILARGYPDGFPTHDAARAVCEGWQGILDWRSERLKEPKSYLRVTP